MISGCLIGKFMPLHTGHIHLIRSAQAQCDHLTILVCSIQQEPIPGWLRYYWVKNTFPELDVRHVADENPQVPTEHASFWEIWGHTIRRNTPTDLAVIFSSETYGNTLAEKLGIRHVCVDPERLTVPVSATKIRQNALEYWAYIPELVRPYYIRRVALLGPESSGKSYLAKHLAKHFETAFVEEYGRTYCEKFGMDLTDLDFAHIAGGQLYCEDEMAKTANRVLFCDTDLIVTQIWSEIYFKGHCQPWILWANHLRRYDLFLLMKPDIPWENDGLREYEHQRDGMFERLLQELQSRNLPHQVISGDFAERTAMAVEAVEKLGIRS